MPSNLLALPREIRDLIYAHAVTDIKHRHALITPTDAHGTHPKYANVVRTTLENAPLLPLLLAHPQLHTEYTRATPASRRHARIRLDTLMSFPTRADAQILRPLILFAPTTLTLVIDDWTRGIDTSHSFPQAKEYLWGQLAMITEYVSMLLPVVRRVRIAARERGWSGMVGGRLSVAPAGPFLRYSFRPAECLVDDPESPKNEGFLLKECRRAWCGADAGVTCLSYDAQGVDRGPAWSIDEVSEIWSCACGDAGSWVWREV